MLRKTKKHKPEDVLLKNIFDNEKRVHQAVYLKKILK